MAGNAGHIYNFSHGLLEVAIDPEQGRGRWLLLVEHLETVGMLYKAPNRTTSSTWKI
jgi:hypothetical protein